MLTSAVVVGAAAVNIAGATSIDRVQSVIVVILFAVFAVFIVTLAQLDTELLAPTSYPRGGAIMSSVALTFFAYLGFTVISFTGGDLPDPARNLVGECQHLCGGGLDGADEGALSSQQLARRSPG
ncbi:hypothetical protein LEP48_16625 [Isoptericola sp. NEAU-Y5]|uniref:Amino acid permease n=1 Tax=Isoptericola luteus TaxID=2879484 RepID=A0ABS7ZKC7_9MICO|nr:hypothetical protein [Isoptericola sp. NEAU-Y5]MCA5894957.1 hypothetical protein [Isoptericola sp. NEAU-Y5]